VPPLEDGAILLYGFRIGLRARAVIIVIVTTVTSLGVADQDNSVVNVRSTASVRSDNTLLVELEGATTGINSNGHRVSLQLLLHTLDTI
jgi:hypothetical protein